MDSREENWVKYITISIAIISLLTAMTAYVSSELSNQGQDDLNEATRWSIFAANAYSHYWIEGSLRHLAVEMADTWYEIANYTGNEADLIQAQHWSKLADEKEERASEKFELYQDKIENGLEPLRESGTQALRKSSQMIIPIVTFQISSTLFVATQITKRKTLFIFGWSLVAITLAYLLPIFM